MSMHDPNQKYDRVSPSLTRSPASKYPPRQILKLSLSLLLVGYTLYVVLFELHARSYVWQSTVLADYVYSDLRTTCDYTTVKTQPQLQKKFHIGIVVLYGKGAVGEWGDDIMKKVIHNRHAYANLHGYEVINANALIDPSRPVAWSKLRAMLHFLPKYDYVMYVDMDAVIMQPNIAVETLIYATEQGPQADIVMQEDWNGPNTGIWLAKNTDWSKNFLQLAWDQSQLVPKAAKNGVSYPFEYEQRAFHYLLDTEKWRGRDLPTFDRERSAEFMTHFSFLPQCAMNSYTLHPLDFRHYQDRKTAQYIDGDFIIHFAGKKGAPKMSLLRHYLGEAEHHFSAEHDERQEREKKEQL